MSTSAQRTPRASLRWIGTLGALLLGSIFLVAAWAKVLDPQAFAEQIRAEGLDFLLPAAVVALIALAIETGLGLALVLNLRRPLVLGATTLLVIFFLFLTGRAYWRSIQGIEVEETCGCFGNLIERTPAEAFWQDLGLLTVPLGLALVGRGASPRGARARVSLCLVGVVAVTVLAWKAPELPLDDLATRLKPGKALADLCAGDHESGERVCLDTILPEEVNEGQHLVLIAALDDRLGEHVEQLGELDFTTEGGLWVLSPSDSDAKSVFYWSWGPTFSIVEEVPPALLRPLYRRLPRSFRLADGVVVETWDGYPPGIESER